ncbi:MAG: hypothetical protein V3R26_01530, partial [Hyphomicrobium sp.]
DRPPEAVRRQLGHPAVLPAMRRHLMPVARDPFDQVWVPFRHPPQHEERPFRPMPAEQVQHPRDAFSDPAGDSVPAGSAHVRLHRRNLEIFLDVHREVMWRGGWRWSIVMKHPPKK